MVMIICTLGFRLSATPLDDYVAHAPFKMPTVPKPSFPAHSFVITNYGAIGDGHTMNTEAFAKAIKACADGGGGHVVIPAGLWLTGPIELQSNVDLHSERGALILFTGDHTAYPMVRRKDWAFVTISPIDLVPMSPIEGINLRNVALTGEGIFDGAGDTWRPVRKAQVTEAEWKEHLAQGGVVSNDGAYWWPTLKAMTGEDYLINLSRRSPHPTPVEASPGRDFRRPPLVYLDNCKKVLIEGVTLRNSPSGALCPTRCADLTIMDATLFNEQSAPSGDGMDINICRNVLVYRCTVSAGDDGICLKSTGLDAPQDGAALRNVIVAECIVYHGHGGFVLGGYTEDGMLNVWATNCDFVGTDVGIRLKSGDGHGGPVRNITVDHVFMKGIVNEAILFDTHYNNYPPSVRHPVTHSAAWFASHNDEGSAVAPNSSIAHVNPEVPEFSEINLRDIYCAGAGTAISISGLAHHPISRVTIRNSIITATRGLYVTQVANVLLDNVQIFTQESPPEMIQNAIDFRVINSRITK
jgi:DNA sulfur modification protein DndE